MQTRAGIAGDERRSSRRALMRSQSIAAVAASGPVSDRQPAAPPVGGWLALLAARNPKDMIDVNTISIRPARRGDLAPLVEFLLTAPPTPGDSSPPAAVTTHDLPNHLVAEHDGHIVGAIRTHPSAGRCAAITLPGLLEWDERLAARLFRAAAEHAERRHGSRLIQTLLAPERAERTIAALERAGYALLATLAYMCRPISSADFARSPEDEITWQPYTRLRHHRFAETIDATYRGSLDCPDLAGLRTVHDSISTHKQTGRFQPRRWRLAVMGRSPVGVALVNELRGRGELVYLGLVPEARGQGVGRALIDRAIQDTAEMGLARLALAVDTRNEPAVRLYDSAGFTETHRRLAYFVPGNRLEALEE